MSGYDSMAISEFFRSGMVNAGLCRIISRGSMETVLAEQRFQMSGCTEQDCVVKMGKLLNAEKIISGKIVSFNEEYYINAKVIDVETGEIQYSEQIKCKDKAEMPKKAEELAWTVSECVSKKKPFFREIQEGRKKFAIYACGVTPFISIPATTQKFVGTQDMNVKIDGSQFPLLNSGVGIKILPWKNICADISVMNDLTQYINVNQKSLSNSFSNNATASFKNCNTLYNLSYIFLPENRLSYTVGGGIDKAAMSWGYDSFNSNNGYWLRLLDSHLETIYFLSIGVEYKLYDSISVSLSSLYLVNNYNTIDLNGGGNILELKPQSPLVFKLSAAYHFNF